MQQLQAIHGQRGTLARSEDPASAELDIPPMILLRPEEVPEDREKVRGRGAMRCMLAD